MKSRADTTPGAKREQAHLECNDTAERDGNTGQAEDDGDQDREAGSTELEDTVNPGAAVVEGTAAESGCRLLVETVSGSEVR